MASGIVIAANRPGLLQFASAALPIGAFSHSLGLEAAVDAGVVHDAASAERWIGDHLELVWARGEAPHWLGSTLPGNSRRTMH